VNKAHDVLQGPQWAAFVWIVPSDGESKSEPTARRQHSVELSEPGLVVFKGTLTPDHREPFVLEGQACSISGAESDKMIQPREPGYLAGRCDEGLAYVDARHAALKGLRQLDGGPTQKAADVENIITCGQRDQVRQLPRVSLSPQVILDPTDDERGARAKVTAHQGWANHGLECGQKRTAIRQPPIINGGPQYGADHLFLPRDWVRVTLRPGHLSVVAWDGGTWTLLL